MQDPLAVSLDQIRRIRSVACGQQHTLILSESGQVLAFGDNTHGQLGQCSVSFSENPILV